MKKMVLLFILIFSVSACTSPLLRTTHFPNSLSKDKSKLNLSSPRIGVPYYLPTALFPITITLDPEEADSSASKKNATIPSSGNTTIIINPPPTDSPKDGASSSSSLISQKIGPYQVTIGSPILKPDMSSVFFLEYNSSFATEDAITFGVGENQLLQSVNATSTDKSGEALVTLAKIAANVAMMVAGKEKSGQPAPKCSGFDPVSISTYLDPTLTDESPFSKSALNALLGENAMLSFNVTPLGNKSSGSPSKTEADNISSPKEGEKNKKSGVLFRVPTAYQLEVTFYPPGCPKKETIQIMVLAPSKDLVYSLNVDRGALITKTTNLTIADGMLTKIEVNKPSSLLGILNVPLDVIKAILSAPAEFLTLRIQKIKAEGDISQAQADKLNSEINKLKNATLLQKTQGSSQ
jgi:hypothetical protein